MSFESNEGALNEIKDLIKKIEDLAEKTSKEKGYSPELMLLKIKEQLEDILKKAGADEVS